MTGETSVLVVGATRILRPAALRLVEQGRCVVAVARTRGALDLLEVESSGQVTGLACDYTSGAFAPRLRDAGPLSGALVYAPHASPEALAVIAGAVEGRVIQLRTSAARAPDAVPELRPRPQWYELVLGWRTDRTWHAEHEISAAALDCLERGTDAVLGALRPWGDRPA